MELLVGSSRLCHFSAADKSVDVGDGNPAMDRKVNEILVGC